MAGSPSTILERKSVIDSGSMKEFVHDFKQVGGKSDYYFGWEPIFSSLLNPLNSLNLLDSLN